MPDWLNDAPVVVLAAIAGVLLVRRFQRKDAEARLVDLQQGKSVMLGASLRGDAAPYPRRWRAGWLIVGIGPPTWWPHFGFARRPVVLPVPVAVEEIRDPAGLKERFIINTDCRIIVVRDQDVNLELAVLDTDLTVAINALAGPT